MQEVTFESIARQLIASQQVSEQDLERLLETRAANDSGADAESRVPSLTCGIPWLSAEANLNWLGCRLIWWPQGLPDFKRVSIVSSRLGARPDQQQRWFDLLRTLAINLDSATEGVVVVESTAAAEYVSRAAQLFGLHALRFVLPAMTSETARLSHWVDQVVRKADQSCQTAAVRVDTGDPPDHQVTAFVSPPLELPPVLRQTLDHAANESSWPAQIAPQPLSDRLLFAAADRLVILRCRSGGVVDQLSSAHVQDDRSSAVPLLVCADETDLLHRLEDVAPNRVIRWVADSSATHSSDLQRRREHARTAACALPDDGPLNQPSEWLCHWTRAQPGPWSDQPMEDWLDELILGCRAADRSALAALLRIVTQRVIRASSHGIRGQQAVVSLTAVPLAEFRARRIFRRHRRRVDFEHFGIAVRRSIAEQLGARPVCYGDEDTWRGLEPERRYLFHPARSQDARDGTPGIDWSKEQEWRLRGDLQLGDIGRANFCCFVPTSDAVELLHSRGIPCIVLPEASPSSDPQ